MASVCEDEMDIWQICHYLLGVIQEFNKPDFIIRGDKEHSINPDINWDYNYIEINTKTTALVVFNFIYTELLTPEFLLSEDPKR